MMLAPHRTFVDRQQAQGGHWISGLVVLLMMAPGFAHSQVGTTTLVSIATGGGQGNRNSGNNGPYCCSVSSDGRFVAFHSFATNLVVGDTNGAWDVFLRDRQTGTTSRISVASDGTQGNGSSEKPIISADGRYVAFSSLASNLVPGDTNGSADMFVRDLQTGTTSRATVTDTGGQGNAGFNWPGFSPSGRYAGFTSSATNFVLGDTNSVQDVFVRDRIIGQTTRVSVANDGSEGDGNSWAPSFSADGRFVAFLSGATNLVSGDTNNSDDIFVRDRLLGTTERISVSPDGQEGNSFSDWPQMSMDGRFVAFESEASNLVTLDTNAVGDVFVRDRLTATTVKASLSDSGVEADGPSTLYGGGSTSISADGRFVAFRSSATNLVPNDTNGVDDIFVRDLLARHTYRVSVATSGAQAALEPARYPSISADGRFVAFESQASNLVLGDNNVRPDIFIHHLRDSARITGVVTLNDFSGPVGAEAVDVEVRDNLGNPVESLTGVQLEANGVCAFDLSHFGQFTIAIKGRTWLRRATFEVSVTPAGVSGLDFHLENGDADGDNEVGIGDYSIISAAYNATPGEPTWIRNADLNGDEAVDIGDYAILSFNYGMPGD